MAYRDTPVDARVAELEALIASEPDVTAELTRVRREHDQLTERENTLGPERYRAEHELEERRAGGVIATVTGWFGRTLEEHEQAVTKSSEQHTLLVAEIAVVTTAEAALRAKLLAITAARTELEEREVGAVDALRAAEGPDGDAVRALDADDERDSTARAAIARVIDLCDLARSALWELDTIVADLRPVTGVGSSVLVVLERIDSPLDTPSIVEDRANVRTRIADAIEYAAKRLDELATSYDSTGLTWFATMPRPRVRELAAVRVADPAEETALAKSSEPLVTCTIELIKGLVAERERLDAKHVERETRRRWLAARRA